MIVSTAEKVCRVCGGAFQPFRAMQIVCGLACARKVPIIARKAKAGDIRKAKKRLDELRPLSYWAKQAQTAFNAWIRWRDRDKPCISCGTVNAGQWDAGHWLSRGSHPELRFDEANCHRQCSTCNAHLSGNLIPYTRELIKRIGMKEVERLEGPHPPKRYRADELRAIRDEYRARLKAEQ